MTRFGRDIYHPLVENQPILLYARNDLNFFLFLIPLEMIRCDYVQSPEESLIPTKYCLSWF